MDLSFLTPVLQDLATAAVTAGIGYGCVLLKSYTGVTISDANEAAIRRAAVTEAGKLISLGLSGNQSSIMSSATKIMNDLPNQVKAEGYTDRDIQDMITGAAGHTTGASTK